MKPIRILLTFAACLSIAAHAANGVIEINQARAVAGSVTPGDTGGFPVTISASGSYILTSNLVATNGGIVIAASNVTIDLNGFTISGTGTGINQTSGSNVTVRNGIVDNMTSSGINLLQNARVENVSSTNNTSDGIIVGIGSVVAHSLVNGNGGRGINAPTEVVLRDNVVSNNANDGPGKTFLLFPYVANGTGLDTTFVISNASMDPVSLTTPASAGTCSVTYYRGSNATTTLSTTSNVPTGQQLSWPMTAGGSNVVPIAAPFTGYLIAECSFAMAHGVAILKDATSSTTLPAYVIKPLRLGTVPESLGN
jgi:hypothetical protein